MSTRPEPRIRYSWVITSAITAPDGYVNVYRDDDGTCNTAQCPAFLVQESRPYWTRDYADLTTHQMEAEGIDADRLEKRVVAADLDGGQLAAADDISSYVGTYHRDDLDKGVV